MAPTWAVPGLFAETLLLDTYPKKYILRFQIIAYNISFLSISEIEMCVKYTVTKVNF